MQVFSFLAPGAAPPPDFLKRSEHFIPYRIDVLLEEMLRDPRLRAEYRHSFRDLRRLLADRFHFEYYAVLESLKSDFVPFDADRETLWEPEFSEEELDRMRIRLYDSIRDVLRIGNYVELTREQLDECLKMQPIGSLSVHVDLEDDFDDFHVYYRGIREREETENYFFLWKRTRPTLFLNRVFVLARFKRNNNRGRVLVKMFKDVAVENIKIIAPKVKLGMPIFDRLKIGGTVLGSLVTPISKLIFAFALSWIYFLLILAGLLFAAFKGIMSFMNSKTKYLHVFSSSLYFRNLSNNRAALTSLVDAAEEQEIKEALLGYFILFINPDREMSMQELDEAAERWIEERFGHRLDFEVDDAVRKLAEKDLIFVSKKFDDSGADREVFAVHDLPEALRRLDEAWDNFNRYANPCP